MKKSLVIPCFNEARALPELVDRCRELVAKDDIEVVLVDNGSTDNTWAAMQTLGLPDGAIRTIRVAENQGYGHGIVSGLRACAGEIVGWTHADLQTDPMDFHRALEVATPHLGRSDFLAKGWRVNRPASDQIFTFGMSVFETILLGVAMRDINAQPTVFTREFMNEWIAEAPSDFSLDLFVYFKAKKRKLPIVRVPVQFGERKFGQSHWNIDWRSKLKFIRRTMDYSLRLRRDVQTREDGVGTK